MSSNVDCKLVATRRFGIDDQIAFAALSGDHNPIHLDAAAARRTQAGAPVAHGMHALLWALEQLADGGILSRQVCQVGAQFRKFIYLDTPCDLVLTRNDPGKVNAELRSNGLVLATVRLRSGPRDAAAGADGTERLPEVGAAATPNTPALSAVAGLSGWTSAAGAAAEFDRAFPSLAAAIGVQRVGALAALSRLVGMYCPGLYSMLAGLTADLVEPGTQRAGIGFKVAAVNDRFRTIGMEVRGSGISGNVTAFMRWPPVEPPPTDTIANIVHPDEFAGAVALIVGGSRGLGAVTAKAIVLGGGRVIMTYAKGPDDAARLASELAALRAPSACVTLAYDSAADAAEQLSALTEDVNQLYYFATPPIFRQSCASFLPSSFAISARSIWTGFTMSAVSCARARARRTLACSFLHRSRSSRGPPVWPSTPWPRPRVRSCAPN